MLETDWFPKVSDVEEYTSLLWAIDTIDVSQRLLCFVIVVYSYFSFSDHAPTRPVYPVHKLNEAK